MAKRKSASFLPKWLQTDKNKKFLHGTLDQLLNSKSLERVDGYIGRRFGPSYSTKDPYISTVGQFRTAYQLEPSVVYKNSKNNIEFAITYDDLINGIKENGGNGNKHDRLFSQESYNWEGFVDYDKLINFGEYYWLPAGPGTANITAGEVPTTANFSVTKDTKELNYTVSPTYGETKNPTIYLVRGGSYTFTVDQDSSFWIQTELGTSGKSEISFNRTTRDIYGVTNNGISNGTITFNVPISTDQKFFTQTVTNVASVDLRCTEYTYNTLNGADYQTVIDNGGIDGQFYLENKTVIFNTATTDSNAWPGTYTDNDKFQVFRVLVTAGTINLLPIVPIGVNQKVQINEGEQFSTFEYYRTTDGTTLTEVPAITAPLSTFYYQDGKDSSRYGVIKLLDATAKIIDIEKDVLGKKNYTTPNGVVFTNGLHIETDTTFAPAKYQNKTYIVDGVGESIILIDKDEQIAHELTSNATKDYIVSKRGSADKNAWARNNNWYHKDVITSIASYNNENPVIDQDLRASRPIIEFKRNLAMTNSGTIGFDAINLIDTTTIDALSMIQNGPEFFIDGVAVTNGMKVVFTNDTELEVRNKIYTVEIVNFQEGSSNNPTEVRLVPSTTSFVAGDQIVAKAGNKLKGKTYWFNGNTWKQAQQKTLVNQAPLFDVFDSDGKSFGDNTNYLSTNFTGSNLFSYGIGSGSADSELGFALKYKNFSNIGDIVFDNKYSTDTFSYTNSAGSVTKNASTGFIKVTDPNRNVSYIDGWTKIETPTTQYQVVTYIANGTAKQFEIGVAPNTGLLPGNVIYLDSVEIKTGWEYKLVEGRHLIEFTTAPTLGTQITIKVLSDSQSSFGYYEVPTNLSNNAFNKNFNDITLGQMRNHVSEILNTAKEFEGVYPGAGNLRDLSDTGKYAGKILHHSSGLVLPGIFLQENHLNISNAIRYASDEYTKFRQKFVSAAETLDLEFEDIPADVDKILASINSTKSSAFPFYYSDMVAHGTNKKIYKYTVTDNRITSYQMEQTFNPKQNTSRSVLVYINDVQAVLGKDYTFNATRPAIELINEPALNTVIKIVDYPNTVGNYIPPTPSKMGLYPKYEPIKFTDGTYATPTEFIQGHDGSLTKSYGSVIDDIILELEKRIYNNIKATYKADVFNIHECTPGRWRDVKFTRTEHQSILSKHFLSWAVKNRIDWTTHEGYDRSNKFTWNYNEMTDKNTKELLPGGWRGIYNHYYDTDRPHTHPWEMIGYTIKPSWWEDIYGPAPYTSGNQIMWEDLRDGKCWNPITQTYDVNPLYKRADLLDMIPVDQNGNLKSPYETMAIGSTVYELDDKWAVGDCGPAQAAWTKSSEYPFALQIANAVMNPAKYFGLMYNTDIVNRTTLTNNIVSTNTNKQLQRSDFITPLVDQNVVNGYSFYIINHLVFLGVAPSTLKDIINRVDINLATKLSGYTDKKFLKVLAEQVSPNAISENVIIPDEDYELVITKTSPIVHAPYSGVIVQQTNSGYALYGYNTTNPVFNVIPSRQSRRVNVHEVLNQRFIEYKDAEDQVLAIPYGTELSTPQQVFDFLIGYGRYLKAQGYDFDNNSEEIANGIEVANWAMAGKEFGYWAQQKWGEDAVITLSPSANKIQFRRADSMVDTLVNHYNGKSVMNQSFENLTVDKFRTKREDGEFELIPDPTSGGIYFADIKTVQYEHTLVLNNTTIFNDIVYQPELGNRQNRLKLVGWRTNNWDGSLTAQGFVLNQGIVDEWVQNTDYAKGEIVKYNDKLYTASESHTSELTFDFSKWTPTDSFKLGLLPNWDTLGGNFESFYDVDTVNLEGSADRFGKSIIGYQSRDYLTNLGLDDTSQVKFYQGMIKEKGTSSAIDKLLRARLDNTTSDIDMYEEWAVRVGEYGGLDINQRVELELKPSDVTGNPTVVHTINSIEDKQEGVKNVLKDKFYKAPPGLAYNWIPTNTTSGLTGDILPYAGYAKLTDADATLFNIGDYANLDAQVSNMKIGYHLYIANDDNNDWQFYYLDITSNIVTSAEASDNNTVLWTTKTNHTLFENDLIVVKDFGAASGVHRVLRSTGLKSFETTKAVEGVEVSGEATVLKFNSIRYKDSSELLGYNPIKGWKLNDKIFIDNVASKGWKVYQKKNEYKIANTFKPGNYTFANGELGNSFAINQDKTIGVFGHPNVNKGTVVVYIPDNQGILGESARINPTNDNRFEGFGHSVDINGKRIVVGSKTATGATEGSLTVYYQTGNQYSKSFAWVPTTSGTSDLNVKFSKDGSKIIAGAPGENKVYVFERTNDTDTFTSTDTFTGDGSTTTFTASADIDGKIITVNGDLQYLNSDYTVSNDTITFTTAPSISADIQVKSGQDWKLIATINGSASTEFGYVTDTDKSGDNIIIGAPAENTNYNNEGAVYIYSKLASTSYAQIQKLLPTLSNAEARFGEAVASNSNFTKLFASAPGVNRLQNKSGMVSKILLKSKDTNIHEGPEFTALATGSIKINGTTVTVAGQDVNQIAETINNQSIANITASVTDNKLSITYNDKIEKLIIINVSGNLFNNVIGDQFGNIQNIVQNALTDGQEFGKSIAINTDGSILVIGAPKSVYNASMTFDEDETKYDSSGTTFIDQTQRGGNAYAYQEIDNNYIQVQKINSSEINTDDQFGKTIKVLDTKDVYIGMPFDDKNSTTDTGAVLQYNIDTDVFTVSEEQKHLVDISRINKVFSYDKVKNEVINYYDWIDPIKGKVPGIADENIDYKTMWDPATYAAEGSATWGPDQVGKIWWNLSTVKYVYPEQSDWAYRSSFWGSVFPGSSIEVYQWIESDKIPENYAGSGVPYSNLLYTTVTKKEGTVIKNRYFYWVRNVLEVANKKTKSAKDVQDILIDPTTFGLKYVAFTSPSDITLFNLTSDLRNSGTILVVDYDKTKNNKIIHNEWALIKENVADATLPANFKTKLIDSLVGADTQGNSVPDNTLNVSEQYGIQFRPRQGLFVKRFDALKTFLTTVNSIMAKNTIALTRDITDLLDKDPEPKQASGDWDQKVANNNELSYVRIAEKPVGYKVLVSTDSTVQNRWSIYIKNAKGVWVLDKLQGYDVSTQWNYIDWYATNFNSETYVNYSVELKKDLVDINPSAGQTVKVNNGGNWELLYYNGADYDTVGIHNATIQIKEGVWNYTSTRYGFATEVFDFQLFDQEPQIETRKIVETILNKILVGDLSYEANQVIFTMLYYVLDEQPYVDWLFKTSFIGVNHKIRALDALPYYRRDNQTYVSDFISEAKPYRTKIREYILNYDKTDPYLGDATDFDLHTNYNTNLGYYRKPDGSLEGDTALLTTGFNKPWNDNHKFEVGSIVVQNGGSGYNFVPEVTISGGGGSGAQAVATITAGEVTGISVTKKGSGYTTTPNVSITTSTGTSATAYVQLDNNKVRTFDTTLKFDRIQFTSEYVDWKPNTAYTTGDKISYQGEAYTATENFTSGATFTSDSLDVVLDEAISNAMDRTIAYYQPTNTQPAKELENIFYGIEYPRNKVTGADFSFEPGMDRAGFDITPFDNFEIGPEGKPMISGIVDTIINSKFGDALLGTKPEDIDIVGGKFVDQHNSHAPEEFIPGRVFDSLDMEIYQTPSSLFGNDGLSPRIDIIKHNADGNTTSFSFQTQDGKHNMNLLVYSNLTGKVQPDEYTIDYSNFTIDFTTAPSNGDVIEIVSVGNTGEDMILDIVLMGDGVDNLYTLPTSASISQQALVIVDGVKKEVTINNVNGRAEIEFAGGFIPAVGAHIHIFVFNLDPNTRIAYSHIGQERFTMDGSTRTFTLANQPLYNGPVDAKVYVELAEQRIRPAVYSYATGDGTETNFAITEAADVDHATLQQSDVSVFIDGVANVAWTLVDNSGVKEVQFTSAPSSGAKIAIGDNTNAEYTISGSTITLDNSLTITSGLDLNVTTFSSHNVLEMTTETFVGSTASTITLASGFDSTPFDRQGDSFDVPTTQIINTPMYTLYRTPTKSNYLWVAKNGIRLGVESDFTIENGQLKILSNIGATDVIVVSQFSENVVKHRIAWKVWHDILGQARYYRMCDDHTTTLAQDLDKTDKEIEVVNASKLATPNLNSNIPGVIWIGGERIVYWEIDGNKLKNIRRGTMGTARAFKHYKSNQVIDGSDRQEIINAHDNIWYTPSDTQSIQYQTTSQAKFLNECVGTTPLVAVTFDQSGRYLATGYVDENYVQINE